MAKRPATQSKPPLNFDGPFLIYDAETSGIPEYHMNSATPGQPRIMELAALLIDRDDCVLDKFDVLIQPDLSDPQGWTVSPEAQAAHGLTIERCRAEGVPIGEVLPKFIEMARRATFRIAHNASFDSRMVRIELRKGGKGQSEEDWWKEFPTYDTQHHATRFCKLPPTEKMMAAGRHNFKSPKLVEAFAHFYPGDPLLKGAHAAEHDVEMCRRVFWAIQRTPEPEVEQRQDAPPPEPKVKKLPDGGSSFIFAGVDDDV